MLITLALIELKYMTRPMFELIYALYEAKKEITLVSGNASEEKSLHPGGRKFIFSINLTEFSK